MSAMMLEPLDTPTSQITAVFARFAAHRLEQVVGLSLSLSSLTVSAIAWTRGLGEKLT